MMTQMQKFGLLRPYYCPSRIFFMEIRHPGASNCACPKFDDGVSCVPNPMRDAWFAYIGLTNADTPTQTEASDDG